MKKYFSMEELTEEALDQILGGNRAKPSQSESGSAFGLTLCCNCN